MKEFKRYIRPCTCGNTGVWAKRIPKCIRGGFEEYHHQTSRRLTTLRVFLETHVHVFPEMIGTL